MAPLDIRRRLSLAYHRYHKSRVLREFHAKAVIGPHMDIEFGAHISNESGERSRIVIGHHCRILGAVICKAQGHIVIGDYTTLQNGTVVGCLQSIRIGSFTGIAEGVRIFDNNTHPLGTEAWVAHRIRVAPGGPGYPGLGNGWELSESAPISIGDAAWIGANSTILKGVTIGDGAVVASGSVVTKNVDAYTIVAGNPARRVKDLPHPTESIADIAARCLQTTS